MLIWKAQARSKLHAHIHPHITHSCLFGVTSVPSAEESNTVAISELETYVSKQQFSDSEQQ